MAVEGPWRSGGDGRRCFHCDNCATAQPDGSASALGPETLECGSAVRVLLHALERQDRVAEGGSISWSGLEKQLHKQGTELKELKDALNRKWSKYALRTWLTETLVSRQGDAQGLVEQHTMRSETCADNPATMASRSPPPASNSSRHSVWRARLPADAACRPRCAALRGHGGAAGARVDDEASNDDDGAESEDEEITRDHVGYQGACQSKPRSSAPLLRGSSWPSPLRRVQITRRAGTRVLERASRWAARWRSDSTTAYNRAICLCRRTAASGCGCCQTAAGTRNGRMRGMRCSGSRAACISSTGRCAWCEPSADSPSAWRQRGIF